jgi:hypothetical protein
VISNAGNQLTGNTLEDLGSGVYIALCKKWTTVNNQIDGNRFIGTDITVETSYDGGQCTTGSSGDTEGVGSWVVGGGTIDGFSATNNPFTGPDSGLKFDAASRWGTSAVPVTTGPLVATCNFWGTADGPTTPSNPGGTGEVLSESGPPQPSITFSPWRIADGGACIGTP